MRIRNEGMILSIIMSIMSFSGLLILGVSMVSAQNQNGITEPKTGDVLSGIVIVRGTAQHPDFLRYELAFYQESRPGNDWIVFAQGDNPVIDGTLAVWDTTVGSPGNPVFPDGPYRLRLRVVRNDYNYDEFFVTPLIIANSGATPSPSTDEATDQAPLTQEPVAGTALAATLQAETGILPSLTPFPTPSPQSTPENAILGVDGLNSASPGEEERGLLEQIRAIDTGQFARSFWFGVTLAAMAFAALALYMVFRTVWRWIWRKLRLR